jgi:PA14 domain
VAAQPNGGSSQQTLAAAQASQSDSSIATFRVTTREVLVDLIALRGRNQPVLDLKPEDLQVFEESVEPELDSTGEHERRTSNTPEEPETITRLRVVDPNASQPSGGDAQGGFQVTESCLDRSTVHYQLAFHPGPDGSSSGYHRIIIRTKRHGVQLFYRHKYYVGLTAPPAEPLALKSDAIDKLLLQASCYYPATPSTISLRAELIDSGRTDVLRYTVAVDARSLSFLTLHSSAARSIAGTDRHVELDYGVCNFDTKGHPVNFFHAPLEGVLSSAEYARALDRGFPHILEFPRSADVALTRVVVRDRQTGNLGMTDVQISRPVQIQTIDQSRSNDSAALASATKENLEVIQHAVLAMPEPWAYHGPPPPLPIPYLQGPVGSFGSIVPNPRSFCGDVYELSHRSANLPDFRSLDPIGSIYTPILDVPNQIFSNTTGIPGMTPRTDLFGIDYHGILWVTVPGEYNFEMASDDGAILRIDDKEVINLDGVHSIMAGTGRIQLNAGRHSIEVRYYQGAIVGVALELWVKPPRAHSWTLFGLNDYVPPAH